VISRATDAFWKAYRNLPDQVQQRARTAYRIWRENPGHPSLQFKQIHSTEPIYSVRIGLGWRAVGVRSGETIEESALLADQTTTKADSSSLRSSE